MKKLTLLLVGMLIIASSFAQKDTSSLKPREVYEDVKAGFTILVNKLEGPAKHTYEVYVKQYRVTGWSHIVGTLLALLFAIILISININPATREGTPGKNIIPLIVGIIFLIIFIVGAIDAFDVSISMALNPEYHAIEKIVESVK